MFTNYIYSLKQTQLFEGMTQKEILSVLSHLPASLHTYQKDETICLQGEQFFKLGIIVTGKVQSKKTYLTQDIVDVRTITACDSFGEDIVCAGCLAMPYSIQVVQDTTLILIDGNSLLTMNKHTSSYMSKFLANIIRLIAKRNLSSSMQIDFSRITSLRKRVAIFLLNHYEETGQSIFSVPLSRSEMANYLSVTRPALSKVLAELKKEEIIDYYKDSFKIQNLNQLMSQ